jgi:glycosyltransferase involved in cell wall biosynthesis
VIDPSLESRIEPGTEVIRVEGGSGLAAWLRLRPNDRGRRPTRTFAGLRRLSDWLLFPDSYAGWARRASAATARRVERGDIDVVLTSSPPDSAHLPGVDAKSRGARWAADFRDPWMGLEFRRPPTAWHRRRQQALERRVIDGADVLLAASRTHAEQLATRLRERGLDPARVVHLPNGYEPATDAGVASGAAPAPADVFLLVYTGTLSLVPDVETFLDALHEMLARVPEARRRLRVRLLGPFDAGYADRAVALGLSPGIVEFTGPRAHAESRAEQRRAATLLHWQPRDFPTMVPGKLYEYFETGRPVLALLDPATEAAELIRAAGGTVVPAGDRNALAAEIERRYLAWKQAGAAEPSAPPAWLAEHRRERLAGRLAATLDRLVQAPA